MKSGDDDIGGKYKISAVQRKMSIDRPRRHPFFFDVEFLQNAVSVQNCAAVGSAHIKQRRVGVVLRKSVAVHTRIVGDIEVANIFSVKIFDAALLNFNARKHLIIRLYESISEVWVDGIIQNVDAKIVVLKKNSAFFFLKNRDFDVVANRRGHQFFPVVNIKTNLIAAA